MRETVRVVLALLTLEQGKSGHVREEGFSWTPGNAEFLFMTRRGREWGDMGPYSSAQTIFVF
jgi:hypothetical protein